MKPAACSLLFPAAAVLFSLAACNKPYVPSAWRTKVPAATRAMADPLPTTQASLTAGSQTYQLYCTGCHGVAGEGRRGRPALNTFRMQGETDGEIYWILDNGSKGHGMPAWRSLGDTDIWQLVQYLRTLAPPPGSTAHS